MGLIASASAATASGGIILLITFSASLPMGLPATCVLALANFVGLYAGCSLFPPHRGLMSADWQGVGFRAVVQLVVALPFWLWALWKVVATVDHDLGAISFALVICANASTAAAVVDNGKFARPESIRRQQWLVGGATAVLAMNYAYVLVAIPGLPFGFSLYLLICTVFWAYSGARDSTLLGRFAEGLAQDDPEEKTAALA